MKHRKPRRLDWRQKPAKRMISAKSIPLINIAFDASPILICITLASKAMQEFAVKVSEVFQQASLRWHFPAHLTPKIDLSGQHEDMDIHPYHRGKTK